MPNDNLNIPIVIGTLIETLMTVLPTFESANGVATLSLANPFTNLVLLAALHFENVPAELFFFYWVRAGRVQSALETGGTIA